MDYSESIQTQAGSTNLKGNSEIDNVVDKNDCDGESLVTVCFYKDITLVPIIMIASKSGKLTFYFIHNTYSNFVYERTE
jgi:hypothetical protein